MGLRELLEVPSGRDWGIAALLGVPSVAQVVLDPIATVPVGLLVAVVSTAPLAWRRAAPVAAAAVGTSAWLVPTSEGFLYLGFAIAAVLFFAVGTHSRSAVRTVAVASFALGAGGWSVARSGQPIWTVATVTLVVVLPVVAGRILAHELEQGRRLEELTHRLEAERGAAERSAAAEERARIARELHDAVGHDVTVIALQADAAASALETDPALAVRPVEAIRATAGSTLAEMRRVLHSLRTEDDVAGPPTAHGAGDVVGLVDRAREMGERVEMVVTGHPVQDATLGAAVYRIVQEGLTNARRHSPNAPVTVQVDWRGVHVRVSHPYAGGPALGGGLGLRGMAERARLAGGSLDAGPTDDGRFVVHAHLPVPRS